MQYMLLITEDENAFEGEAGAALIEKTLAGHMVLVEELNASGVDWSGNRLQPGATATTIKWDAGEHALHDGAHSETHEELGGYYIIDVDNLDEALNWAKKIPILAKGAVEVRPIWQQ